MTTSHRARVAVVDDEPVLLEAWRDLLRTRYEVTLFSDPIAARTWFEKESVDLALIDIRMPGMDGLTLLEALRRLQPGTEAIMVTAHGTVEMAVQALHLGAYDFVCKPIDDLESILRKIEKALDHGRLCALNASLRSRLEAMSPATELIGESRDMQRVRALIAQIADSNAPVLIRGESGTGKELAARALHLQSCRAGATFVAVNCAAIPETLIDSELFGHEKGAFTGAVAAHKGLFEAASGGVLFLDEIGDVPLPTQVRLLRALQEGEVRPVGATQNRKVDVRVVAATNVDLERAMRAGTFREDLFYRISTFRLELPPLRQRREDIPLIAQYLLQRLAQKAGRTIQGFTDEALAKLTAHAWQGNVRELANALEHAVTLCAEAHVDVQHLPSFVQASAVGCTAGPAVGSLSSAPFTAARTSVITDFETRYLKDLLAATDGNQSEAARRAGLDRSNLRRLLRRYGMLV